MQTACTTCWCSPCVCRSHAPQPPPEVNPNEGTWTISSLTAAPGFAPQAWAPSTPQEMFTGYKPPVEWSEDLRRIIDLPRRKPPVPGTPESQALVALMNSKLARQNDNCVCRLPVAQGGFGRDCIKTLLPVQAWALYEIALMQGLLGPIGVGQGKTIIDLLAALTMPNCKHAVLLCPPGLVEQLVKDFKLVGQHFWMPHIICLGKTDFATTDGSRTDPRWADRIPDGAPTLHVFPYSLLSQPSHTVWLETMQPDAIFADEAHSLSDRKSARTVRLLRFFEKFSTTRFACWTGSLSDDSLEDYAHLAALALRFNSPVPVVPEVVKEWGRALDAGSWLADPGALMNLCGPDENVRTGFRRRLHETPGVVHTIKAPVDAKLEITERKVDVPPEVLTVLNTVRATWVRPDYLAYGGKPEDGGEELVDQFALGRCMRELACGFFYRWKFPRGEATSLILEWLEIRKHWHKEMREKLKERAPHLDSPLLCARAAARAYGDDVVIVTDEYGNEHTSVVAHDPDLPVWPARWWPAWRDIRDQVKPKTEAVRFNDFLAQDAATWAKANRGIVWYDKREFGQWVAELSGLPMYTGGPQGGGLLDQHGNILERGDRSIILSIKAHGTGRDGLQFIFHNQLIANPMASSVGWEQLLGRLHRMHQKAPVVYGSVYKHTPELAKFISKALMRAGYVNGTLGAEQKLIEGMSDEFAADLESFEEEQAMAEEGW
jgi:hypothetical protein